MNTQNPYETLGITENASFEEIQDAKKRLSQEFHEDSKVVESIEAAYDAIIMDRLRLRQEGKIKVPERIRFPERGNVAVSNPSTAIAKNSPGWLKDSIDNPSARDILICAAVFLVLAVVTVANPKQDTSLLSFLMALGFSASIYFLNRKENRFGRSVLISLIGLLLGFGLGSAFANLLSSQGLGIGLELEQFASLVTFCVFWIFSTFLR